jgi:hypothetical protein
MKLPSPRNHTDVALLIFCALRTRGERGLQLRTSKCLWSKSRYVYIGKHTGVRVSNHEALDLDPRVTLNLVGHDIADLTHKATVWLKENYGIEVQTTG